MSSSQAVIQKKLQPAHNDQQQQQTIKQASNQQENKPTASDTNDLAQADAIDSQVQSQSSSQKVLRVSTIEQDLAREGFHKSLSAADDGKVSIEERELLTKLELQNAALFPPLEQPQVLQQYPVSQSLHDSKQDIDWTFWGLFMSDFDSVVRKNYKLIVKKLHLGIPKSVRGSLWFQMCQRHPQSYLKQSDLQFQPPQVFHGQQPEDVYVELLKLTSSQEKVIIRDLSRTFPKHEFFKDSEGMGQESLFNVMKAYSLYDPEIGYCQGSGFIAATLLLHMPEEQAFACFVHLMLTYQLRNMFTPQMELLQQRLFMFDCLVEEMLPTVHLHLQAEGIRSTMYASQWFLTLFSYRFPLEIVFRLLDIIFATGIVPGVSGSEFSGGVMDTVLQSVSDGVAVAAISQAPHTVRHQEVGIDVSIVVFRYALSLMKRNEDTILALDFEPLLEFLKSGMFQVYATSFKNTSTGHFSFRNSSETSQDSRESSISSLSPRDLSISKSSIDKFVLDAMSSQFKLISRKKIQQLKKLYEDEIKNVQPAYLAEKTLDGQISRLTQDLKRSELMLSDLNKEHCDLAGQMITLRVELAKEKEANELLKMQIEDLKSVIAQPIVLTVDAENDSRTPTKDEQLAILHKQNAALLEELYQSQVRKPLSHTRQGSQNSGEGVVNWKKLFVKHSTSPTPQ